MFHMYRTNNGAVARFMDGLDLVYNEIWCIRDSIGKERVGTPILDDHAGSLLFDEAGRRILRFMAESDELYGGSFLRIPAIEKAAVLYKLQVNPMQRCQDFNSTARYFTSAELFLELIRSGNLQQRSLKSLGRVADDIGFLYEFCIDQVYDKLKGRWIFEETGIGRLGFEYFYNPFSPYVVYNESPIKMEFNREPTFQEFLASNSELLNRLVAQQQVSKDGVRYDAMDMVVERLRRVLPDEILEAHYQRFLGEYDAMDGIEVLRGRYPPEDVIPSVEKKPGPSEYLIATQGFEQILQAV